MAHEKFSKPIRGTVWLDGGTRVPATIKGEWNGFAVADVAAKDVGRLLRDSDTTVSRRGNAVRVSIRSMGETRDLAVRRGRVSLGDGWALNWQE